MTAELQEVENFIKVHQKLSSKIASESEAKGKPTPAADILEAAREILRDKGRPMPVADLYDALVAKGFVIGGKNPRNNLGAKLASAPDLKTRRGLGWYFKKDAPMAKVMVMTAGTHAVRPAARDDGYEVNLPVVSACGKELPDLSTRGTANATGRFNFAEGRAGFSL